GPGIGRRTVPDGRIRVRRVLLGEDLEGDRVARGVAFADARLDGGGQPSDAVPGVGGFAVEIADGEPGIGAAIADQALTRFVERDVEFAGDRSLFVGHHGGGAVELHDLAYRKPPCRVHSSIAVRSAACSAESTVRPYFTFTRR